jgi:hypothetical protein
VARAAKHRMSTPKRATHLSWIGGVALWRAGAIQGGSERGLELISYACGVWQINQCVLFAYSSSLLFLVSCFLFLPGLSDMRCMSVCLFVKSGIFFQVCF